MRRENIRVCSQRAHSAAKYTRVIIRTFSFSVIQRVRDPPFAGENSAIDYHGGLARVFFAYRRANLPRTVDTRCIHWRFILRLWLLRPELREVQTTANSAIYVNA